MTLKLTDGRINDFYVVRKINLPLKTAKRLEALGMTYGAHVGVLNKKKSAMVIELRGTRFALGRTIAKNIEMEALSASEGGK